MISRSDYGCEELQVVVSKMKSWLCLQVEERIVRDKGWFEQR
jgi:hypothetical protein